MKKSIFIVSLIIFIFAISIAYSQPTYYIVDKGMFYKFIEGNMEILGNLIFGEFNFKNDIEKTIPYYIYDDETSVAIVGPPVDNVIKNLTSVIASSRRIQHFLVVDKNNDVLPTLAKIYKKGKKIKYLILGGHGDCREIKNHGIVGLSIGSTTFGDYHIDLARHIGEIQKKLLEIENIKKDIKVKKDLAIENIEDVLYDLEFSEWQNNYRNLQKAINYNFNFLNALVSTRGIMADNAVIVLFSCCSGMPDHMWWARKLASHLLEDKEGYIIVHEAPIKIAKPDPGQDNLLKRALGAIEAYLSGSFKLTEETYLIYKPKSELIVPQQDENYKKISLPLFFDKICYVGNIGETIEIKANVLAFSDSERLTYYWKGQPMVFEDNIFKININILEDNEHIELIVKDNKGREGRASLCMIPRENLTKINIDLNPRDNISKGSKVTVKANLDKHTPPKDSFWIFQTSGGLKILSTNNNEATIEVNNSGVVFIFLSHIGLFGKDRIIAKASLPIKLQDISNQEKILKADKLWRECDELKREGKFEEALKKCEESLKYFSNESRIKSVNRLKEMIKEEEVKKSKIKEAEKAEQEKKKIKFFECLCFNGGYSDFGAWYDPNCKPNPMPGSSPEIKEMRGPCMVTEGGIQKEIWVYCYPFPDKSEIIKHCFKTVFGKETKASSLKEVLELLNHEIIKPTSLSVKLIPDTKTININFGDVVTIKAEAEGGKPPYTYQCKGDGMGKDREFIFAKGRQPGRYPVTVTVKDSEGKTSTASTTIVVNAVTVKLEKLSPSGNTVTVVGKASFKATVMAGKDLAKGDFVIRWEPYKYKVAEFKEREIRGAVGQNEVKFMVPGRHFVYVDVLQNIEGRLQTVGESEQITIEVKNPQLQMTFEPERPLVGKIVKATVKAEGISAEEMKGMNFQWIFPDNAKQTGPEQRDGVASFYLKDTKPANIQCVVRLDGENLGGVGRTITAQGYQVSISQPRYLGPKPRIWKCDTQLGGACPGLVEVADTQFAVFRDIFMKATVTPTPESPRYRWSIDPPGSCGFPGAGDEIKLNCSQTGTYTVKVEVTNADGTKLGEATQTVTVSISDEMLKQTDKSKQAYDKVQQAKQLVGQGKLDEAINIAQEAVSLDPKNQEVKSLSDKWTRERDSINRNIDNANKLINEKKFADAEKELSQAKALHPKYAKVLEAEKRLNEERNKKQRADQLWNECIALTKQNRHAEALGKCKESLNISPDERRRQAVAQLEQESGKKQKADELWNQCINLAKANRLDEAINRCEQSLSYWISEDRQRAYNQLKSTLQKTNEENKNKQIADRLWNECIELARQKNYEQAWRKCDESLKYWRNDQRIEATAKLKEEANKTKTSSTGSQTVISSVNLSGTWVALCRWEGDSRTNEYEIKISQTESNFTAKSDYEDYRGVIRGNKIEGKSSTGDKVAGTVIDQNFIKVTIHYIGTGSGYGQESRQNCELRRKIRQQSGNTVQQGRTINAELTNNSRDNVHIFVEGQDTFGSHNRVTPGERKTVSIKAPAQGGFINFVAGRNGQILAKCRWEYVPDYQNRVPVVRFSDPNILSCSNGLR